MRVTYGVLLVAAALFAGPLAFAADPPPQKSDVFTVAAVPVDATADSASAARDEARLDGERRAFQILLDRLTPGADRSRLPRIDEALLDSVIGSFEVAHERRSSVRYLADYTFHFNATAVRQLLTRAGIPFAETTSKPLVVLPVLDATAGPVLWEDPNPWRDAWAMGKLPPGLVQLIIPYGDLQDVTAIDGRAAESGDSSHLQALAQRYGDVGVLVTRATLKADADPHVVEISSTRYDPGAATAGQSWMASYTAKPGQSDADLLAQAVTGTATQVGTAWKSANTVDFSHAATLNATVPVSDLQGWVDVRDRLAGIPSIRRTELLSLDRQVAHVAIHYVGDTDQLRLALQQRDLDLGGTDPDWVIQRRGAEAPQ